MAHRPNRAAAVLAYLAVVAAALCSRSPTLAPRGGSMPIPTARTSGRAEHPDRQPHELCRPSGSPHAGRARSGVRHMVSRRQGSWRRRRPDRIRRPADARPGRIAVALSRLGGRDLRARGLARRDPDGAPLSPLVVGRRRRRAVSRRSRPRRDRPPPPARRDPHGCERRGRVPRRHRHRAAQRGPIPSRRNGVRSRDDGEDLRPLGGDPHLRSRPSGTRRRPGGPAGSCARSALSAGRRGLRSSAP